MTAMDTHAGRIEVASLVKDFGEVRAVADLSFSVEPGVVTGFLGPNGAGKTTTLRCLLGLVTPTSGSATIGGRPYADLADPLGTVGAALEAASFHPGRSALAHLQTMALAAGIPTSRCRQMLDQVGLGAVASKRVGGFSMGMRQRLGLAGALLGDPSVLILDEPANGLDPAGIAWLRNYLRALAGEGRTVLISSHVLSEVQQTVEDVVVLARGRLVRQGKLADLGAEAGGARVRTPEPEKLRDALSQHGLSAGEVDEQGRLHVPDADLADVGHAAYVAGIELHELSGLSEDLETTFLELTGEAQ